MGNFRERLRNLANQKSQEARDRENAERRREEFERMEDARKLKESEAAIGQYAVPVLQDVNINFLGKRGKLEVLVAKGKEFGNGRSYHTFGGKMETTALLLWDKRGDDQNGSIRYLEISTYIHNEPRKINIGSHSEILLSEKNIRELIEQNVIEILERGGQIHEWNDAPDWSYS